MTDGYIALNDLLPKLDALDGKSRVTVHINSVGGDLLSGIAIYNRLKSLSGQIITVCDSLAASAGSIIFQAGDVRQVYASSTVMVHHALTIMWGMYNAADLRKSAEDLDGFDRQLVNAYVERTGLDEATVLEHMDAESWMVGQEAVDAGFADQVIAGEAQTISDSDTPGVLNVGRLRVAAHFIPARSETCGSVAGSSGDISAPSGAPNSTGRVAPAALPGSGPKARDEPAANAEAAKNIDQKGKEPMNKKLFARNEAPEEEQRTEAEETEEQRPENEGEDQPEQEPAAEITTVEELREAYPDLVEQIEEAARSDGAEEENARLAEIEEIESEVDDPEETAKAKFGKPSERCDASALLLRAVKARAGRTGMRARMARETSAAAKVRHAAAPDDRAAARARGNDNPAMTDALTGAVQAFNKSRK